MPVLACIVEGHGETTAFPVLIRRVAAECGIFDLQIPKPIRSPKSKLLVSDPTHVASHLDRVIRLATNLLPSRTEGALLVSLDSDRSCPRDVADKLKALVTDVREDLRCHVVLPKMEFEAWFLAALPSLAEHRGIDVPPVDSSPESVQGAKELVSRYLFPGDQSYSETVDQQKLAAVMSLQEAAQCRSFQHFLSTMRSILTFLYPAKQRQVVAAIDPLLYE
jgi:hypothetical protein